MAEKVTIQEIAEMTGVSPSTVSRVLNQPDLVKPNTRETVYSAIKELNYLPPARKQDNQEKKYTLGLAVPNIRLTQVGELIREIEIALENTEYDLLVINMKNERNVYEFFRKNPDHQKKIDALMIFSAKLDEAGSSWFRSLDIPVIIMQNRCHKEKSISNNNYLGGYDATKFLLSRGYTKIAFIGWNPVDEHLSDRLIGYKNAIASEGVIFENSMVSLTSLNVKGGYEATKSLLKQYSPDAIFYASDNMAMGGFKYFKENTIHVPDDIGIIGFDDLEFAGILGLTTMKQFIDVKARIAVTYLLDRLKGKIEMPLEEELCITPKIIIRNSTN